MRDLVPGLDTSRTTWLLCDVDGNLIPSEEPAFEASATVYNRVLASLGVDRRYDGEELRRDATGRNFRSMLEELAESTGALDAARVDQLVAEENLVVTEHLSRVLSPDESLTSLLRGLAGRVELAAVSSSALRRLDACFNATGLADLFPPARRFSAQDSLPRPTSKPDPAVYRCAARVLGVEPEAGLAVEDAAAGVQSAVGAGFATIGNLAFVAPDERPARRRELLAAGAACVVDGWDEIAALLDAPVTMEHR